LPPYAFGGPPKHGTPLCFLPLPKPYAPPKSIDIEIERPISLAGGERTRGSNADGDMLLVGEMPQ